MNILIILAHPDSNSLNYSIARQVETTCLANGHHVVFHDLHREQFDPIMHHDEFLKEASLTPQIQEHVSDLKQADGIVIVHPNWWGQPPAILKGWIDRVIRPGEAYEFLENPTGDGTPVGLLKAKTAVVFNTSNASAEREMDMFGDPLEVIWKQCVFKFCGIERFIRRMYRIVVISSKEERQAWLADVADIVTDAFTREK